jgi:hypothetical protein
MQADLSGLLTKPVAQSTQEDAPVAAAEALHLPAGHSVQELAPAPL